MVNYKYLAKWFVSKFISWKQIKQAAPLSKEGEREFVFVWYKETVVKTTANEKRTSYSIPCRTKIFATTIEEAKSKLTDFALSKTKLVIHTETEWKSGGNELEKFMKDFYELNKKFSNVFAKRSYSAYSHSDN